MDIKAIRLCCALLICPYLCVTATACPNGDNTTCCACVSSPGCSWFSPPGSTGYCDTSPYLESGGHATATDFPAWSNGGVNGVFPSQASQVTVMRNQPFSLRQGRMYRPIMLRPQQIRLKLAVGVRNQVLVRLTSLSSSTRLSVFSRGVANGEVEFGLEKADDNSCSVRLRELNFSRIRGRRGRANRTAAASRRARSSRRTSSSRRDGRYPSARVYYCRGDGPGVVHNLLLNVDVKRCLRTTLSLRVMARSSRSTSLPLNVRLQSACDCPRCASNSTGPSNATFATTNTTPPCNTRRCNWGNRMNHTSSLSPQARLCLRRGVNNECVSGNGATGPVCSGRGLCVCGQCSCRPRHDMFSEQRYSGTYCECDDYSCPSALGSLCGGPNRGVCQCGQCRCQEGWTGDACDISTSVDQCVAASSSEAQVCSGRGTCVSGLCECPYPYSGQFCQCDGLECPQD